MCQPCDAYVTGTDDTRYYYEHVLEPKLDFLCDKMLKKAAEVIRNRRPVFEVELTQKERYFSSDSMEFFTGESGTPARYSSVKKMAVWVHGLTLVVAWTRDGINYNVSYVYTADSNFEPVADIRVGAYTSVLEKFFNGKLYDISAEEGSLGHLQAVWGNDDWTIPIVLVSYSYDKIREMTARNDNAYGDKVPAIPISDKIKKYVSAQIQNIKKRAIDELERQVLKAEVINLDDHLYLYSITSKWPLEQKTKSHGETQTPNTNEELQPRTIGNNGTWNIVMFSLLIGAAISVLAVFVCKALFQDTFSTTEVYDDRDARNEEHERDYVDAEFTEETPSEEFDYPYEDIGDVLR